MNLPLPLKKVEPGTPVTAEWANGIVDALLARTPQPSPELALQQNAAGFWYTPKRRTKTGGGATVCSFSGSYRPDDYEFKFSTVGAINGILPTNMFADGNTLVTLSSVSFDAYVWVECTSTDGQTIETVTLGSGAFTTWQVPTENEAPGTFKIPLYYISDTRKAWRIAPCSLSSAYIQEVFEEDKLAFDCGEYPRKGIFVWRWE